MNAVEILALIFSVGVIVKMAVFFFMPKALGGVVDQFLEKKNLFLGLLLGLTLVVGYFILTNVIIEVVVAVMLLSHLLIGLMFVQYPKEVQELTTDILKDRYRIWLVALIYVLLAVGAFVAVLV